MRGRAARPFVHSCGAYHVLVTVAVLTSVGAEVLHSHQTTTDLETSTGGRARSGHLFAKRARFREQDSVVFEEPGPSATSSSLPPLVQSLVGCEEWLQAREQGGVVPLQYSYDGDCTLHRTALDLVGCQLNAFSAYAVLSCTKATPQCGQAVKSSIQALQQLKKAGLRVVEFSAKPLKVTCFQDFVLNATQPAPTPSSTNKNSTRPAPGAGCDAYLTEFRNDLGSMAVYEFDKTLQHKLQLLKPAARTVACGDLRRIDKFLTTNTIVNMHGALSWAGQLYLSHPQSVSSQPDTKAKAIIAEVIASECV